MLQSTNSCEGRGGSEAGCCEGPETLGKASQPTPKPTSNVFNAYDHASSTAATCDGFTSRRSLAFVTCTALAAAPTASTTLGACFLLVDQHQLESCRRDNA